MRVVVTGGAGFIGSALCRSLILDKQVTLLNIDKLTYAANLASLAVVQPHPDYHFLQADICDRATIERAVTGFKPDAIMHLAAESHVDRSITGPDAFIQTNVVGTHCLLSVALDYWQTLKEPERDRFRFLHVSTDEVFGSLGPEGAFSETSPYDPSSPYSASKAASDHLARAWCRTYGLPVILSNCSNNYGPYQFPEKLIPLMTLAALEQKSLPVYGNGAHVRDWLHVEDHVSALWRILQKGRPGETYNVGGASERSNLDVVRSICSILDEAFPDQAPHARLITHVPDRPGHDARYAIDASKLQQELDWRPSHSFESGLRGTVRWYLENEAWWRPLQSGVYAGERLGLLKTGEGGKR